MGPVIIWCEVALFVFCTGACCSETLGEALIHLGIFCIFRDFSAQIEFLAIHSSTSGYFEVVATFISSIFTVSSQKYLKEQFPMLQKW